MALVPVLYVASFGPACWVASRLNISGEMIPRTYPLVMRARHYGPTEFVREIDLYAELGSAPDWHFNDYMTSWQDSDGNTWVGIRCLWRK